MLRMYTDGSCTNNGRNGARAGYAVVYPDRMEKSWGDYIGEATNQTAEMTGIYEGLVAGTTLMGDPSQIQVKIYTDSEYSINCLTKWVKGWKARDWKTSEGKPVVHRVLIEKIMAELAKYASHVFTHVKAHTGGTDEHSKWNQLADDLARKSVETKGRVTNIAEPRVVNTSEYVLPGIPLALMGAPISEKDLIAAIRGNLDSLDQDALGSALISALKKSIGNHDLTKTKIHKTVHYGITDKSQILKQDE